MLAILDNDIIIKLSIADGTEIGSLPSGVGLERLRFDGQDIIDLATLTSIWVCEPVFGFYELHVVPLPNSQLVAMTYSDRNRLITEVGIIRVKTIFEIDEEVLNTNRKILKNRLVKRLERGVGENVDQHMDILKLLFAIIVYARTGNAALGDFFDTIIPEIIDTFPLSRVRGELIQSVKNIKIDVDKYYTDLDALN